MAGPVLLHRGRPSVWIAVRHVAGILCLLATLAGGYLLSLWPQGRGQVRLERLPGPSVVVRDELGVPCIWASSLEAGLFAMGYAHAQDRLWQMEVLRRAAWGELAPIATDAALPLDMLHRRIGFYRQALRLRAEMAADERRLQSYAWGINAYLRAHPTRLPPEFLAARLRPALWQTEDVLAVGAMIEWLALPCSLRMQGNHPATQIDGSAVLRASLPPGLRPFLSPIQIDVGLSGDAVRCALTWDAHKPQPWVETGLVAEGKDLVRGWCIPGWPLPHVAATARDLMTATQASATPWHCVDVEGWRGVLEFLYDTVDGPCETVRVEGPFSAVTAAQGGHWWVTAGSPRFTSSAVRDGLEVWHGGASMRGENSPFTVWPHGAANPSATVWATEDGSTMASFAPRAYVPFSILDLLTPFPAPMRGPRGAARCAHAGGESAPAAVLIQWELGQLSAVQMFGQSGVVGNRHRRDQHGAWSRAKTLRRSLRLPDFSQGCALVPLLP